MTRRELIVTLLAGPVVELGSGLAAQSNDLTTLTVAEGLAQITARRITPLQLTEAYLARIAKVDPGLNAFITVTGAHARAGAKRASAGSLRGIPIAHKDLFETAGVRTTAGSRLFEEHIPATNAAIVERFERAGAVLLGKTNTHELGGGVTTINPFFGTTRNPIDRSRIAGGSSGGSAAAVAARLCAAATGSDTGGSVRIPAAFCGCVGFKPTFGRISTTGLLGACPTFDHVGFLTRTVEDAEILFRAALGSPMPTLREPQGRPEPSRGASRNALPSGGAVPSGSALPSSIRFGVPRAFFFEDLARDVAGAIEGALATLRARGARVEDVAFPIDSKTMPRVFDPVVVFEIWGRFGADWPTHAAGTPAISVPCGRNAAGLPIGLQIVGRRGQDDALLRTARLISGGLGA